MPQLIASPVDSPDLITFPVNLAGHTKLPVTLFATLVYPFIKLKVLTTKLAPCMVILFTILILCGGASKHNIIILLEIHKKVKHSILTMQSYIHYENS